jgi:hypothetical protein
MCAKNCLLIVSQLVYLIGPMLSIWSRLSLFVTHQPRCIHVFLMDQSLQAEYQLLCCEQQVYVESHESSMNLLVMLVELGCLGWR